MSKRVLGKVGLIAGLGGIAAAATAYYLKQKHLNEAENGSDTDASDTTLAEVDKDGNIKVSDDLKEQIIADAREMIHRNKDNAYILESLENKYGKDCTYSTLKELIEEAEQ
ncbi:hypothetical protein [Lactobacillus sp. PV034]|uniref:hypothetical protein n=1 Tax=Lactobacillus sp. PV034 TaxID=2594495 RepID=UPI002240D56D|nr:hypothetical protein [Lactobacillus sp. PV034]QNQ80561.1 hypothetical protein FP432_02865 [Lactobacillus sp. PV034]